MDCNKEEAVRAKELAEKKMEIKDFSGALKTAVKAQQIYPELENISQLILVCEVHCSAEKKSYGTDKDWYGILKIESNADDIAIKKQYRKLALVLHPDKNNFPGATDAFKLIGEAQRVLLDREKRLIHDSKRNAFGSISAASRTSNVQPRQHPWNQGHPGNFTTGYSGNVQFTQQRAPTGISGHASTFWTACPFCSIRYKFYRDVLNTVISCQSCKKSFSAYEFNAHHAPAAPTAKKTQTPQHQNRVSPKPAEGQKRNFTTKPVFEKKEPSKAQVNVNRKRKKRKDDFIVSSDSSESSESDEDVEVNGVPNNVDKNRDNPDFQYFGEPPRRSSRSKRNVSYKENINDIDNGADGDHDDDDDDDDVSDDAIPSNPAENGVEKHASRKEAVEQVVENKKTEVDDEKYKSGENANDDDAEEEEIEPKVFECPDPEFSDFDKYRKEESFSAGQIWACYDTEDAMPRFYALIRKKYAGFKLLIQWLKPDPVTTDEKKWVEEDLPVSCGRYRHEKIDKSQDLFSFSHLVTWEAGQKVKRLNIVPRKGETWAVFKNWSMNWYSCNLDDGERKYEYEFVEILSDFDENSGVRVAYLEKVKGFVCLFMRIVGGEMVITESEKFRFAHMVPSCRMSGGERDGVPKGSYELDPAALPASIFE